MAFTPEYQQLGVDGPAPGNGWIPSSTGPGSRWNQKSVHLSFDTTTLEVPADLWLHLSREILAITEITISEPKEPGEGAQVEIPGSPGRIPVRWQG